MNPRRRRAATFWRHARQPPVGYRRSGRATPHRHAVLVSWFYYWVTAHTTPRLLAVGAVGVAPVAMLLMIGFDTRASLVGFAVLAWLVACMLIGFVVRPRLAVEAQMPPRVECGSRFETRYRVTNIGRRTAREIGLDTLVYSDWLSLRLQPARLETLAPGASDIISGFSLVLRRGSYVLPDLRYDSGFPCGLWRWGRRLPGERSLFVYPRYARLDRLDLPLGNRRRPDLSSSAELSRAALEFHGCREFRDGDALRHVHPRSSARVGVPVVKEFQSEGRARTALLVDTRRAGIAARLGWRSDPHVEAALSLAAAIVDSLAATDRVLELLVAGPDVYRFRSAGRVGYLEDVLDILAAVEPGPDDPLDHLEPLLFEEIRTIQSIGLILTSWDARRQALVREIGAWGVGLKTVLIVPPGGPPAELPPDVVCVSVRAVRRGEVREL